MATIEYTFKNPIRFLEIYIYYFYANKIYLMINILVPNVLTLNCEILFLPKLP